MGEHHEHEHGRDREHVHDQSVGEMHQHLHSHAHTKDVLNRLSRAIGHLESVRNMVEDGRDCSEVLVQLAAVRAAIGSVSRVILKDHIEHCIVHAVEENDQKAIAELEHAIDKLL